jgi:hypothetical protein
MANFENIYSGLEPNHSIEFLEKGHDCPSLKKEGVSHCIHADGSSNFKITLRGEALVPCTR